MAHFERVPGLGQAAAEAGNAAVAACLNNGMMELVPELDPLQQGDARRGLTQWAWWDEAEAQWHDKLSDKEDATVASHRAMNPGTKSHYPGSEE